MPEFVNPFSGKVPDRKLTLQELIRAIRMDLSAEEEAVHTYMAHAEATDDPLAKAVLIDIANEERVHVGEFARLISILTGGEEDGFLKDGAGEVDVWAQRVSGAAPAAVEKKDETTVGSLKSK